MWGYPCAGGGGEWGGISGQALAFRAGKRFSTRGGGVRVKQFRVARIVSPGVVGLKGPWPSKKDRVPGPMQVVSERPTPASNRFPEAWSTGRADGKGPESSPPQDIEYGGSSASLHFFLINRRVSSSRKKLHACTAGSGLRDGTCAARSTFATGARTYNRRRA